MFIQKKIPPHLETASFGAGSAYGTVICSTWIPLTLPLLIHSISAHISWCVTKARYHLLCLLVAKLLYQSKIKLFLMCAVIFFSHYTIFDRCKSLLYSVIADISTYDRLAN